MSKSKLVDLNNFAELQKNFNIIEQRLNNFFKVANKEIPPQDTIKMFINKLNEYVAILEKQIKEIEKRYEKSENKRLRSHLRLSQKRIEQIKKNFLEHIKRMETLVGGNKISYQAPENKYNIKSYTEYQNVKSEIKEIKILVKEYEKIQKLTNTNTNLIQSKEDEIKQAGLDGLDIKKQFLLDCIEIHEINYQNIEKIKEVNDDLEKNKITILFNQNEYLQKKYNIKTFSLDGTQFKKDSKRLDKTTKRHIELSDSVIGFLDYLQQIKNSFKDINSTENTVYNKINKIINKSQTSLKVSELEELDKKIEGFYENNNIDEIDEALEDVYKEINFLRQQQNNKNILNLIDNNISILHKFFNQKEINFKKVKNHLKNLKKFNEVNNNYLEYLKELKRKQSKIESSNNGIFKTIKERLDNVEQNRIDYLNNIENIDQSTLDKIKNFHKKLEGINKNIDSVIKLNKNILSLKNGINKLEESTKNTLKKNKITNIDKEKLKNIKDKTLSKIKEIRQKSQKLSNDFKNANLNQISKLNDRRIKIQRLLLPRQRKIADWTITIDDFLKIISRLNNINDDLKNLKNQVLNLSSGYRPTNKINRRFISDINDSKNRINKDILNLKHELKDTISYFNENTVNSFKEYEEMVNRGFNIIQNHYYPELRSINKKFNVTKNKISQFKKAIRKYNNYRYSSNDSKSSAVNQVLGHIKRLDPFSSTYSIITYYIKSKYDSEKREYERKQRIKREREKARKAREIRRSSSSNSWGSSSWGSSSWSSGGSFSGGSSGGFSSSGGTSF